MAKTKTPKKARKPATKAAKSAKKGARKAKSPGEKLQGLPKLRNLTPYIAVDDAAGAIEWYKKVFGAKELARMPAPDGKVMHADLKIGDSRLMLSDVFPGSELKAPRESGAPTATLHIDHKDAPKMWDRALANGGKVVMPFEDQFWGDRFGKLLDPFGHSWALATRSKLTKAQLKELEAKAMAEFAASG